VVRLLLRLVPPSLITVVVFIGLLRTGQMLEAPKVLPLIAVSFWLSVRRPASLCVRVGTVTSVWVACSLSFGGQVLSADQTWNRITHGGFAFVLFAIVAFEFGRLLFPGDPAERTWRVTVAVALVGFGLTVCAGVFMEFAEAVSVWEPLGGVQRFQDTILDLAADVVGAFMGLTSMLLTHGVRVLRERPIRTS
jgi:hypothetical protein